MQDQHHERAHLFGAAGPGGEAAFALVLPTVNTDTMQIFLDRFAETLAKDEHAVVGLDGAGCNAIADDAERIRSLCLYPYIRKVIG